MRSSPRLDKVDRYTMLRAAHLDCAALKRYRGAPLWVFVSKICCVGCTSANEICIELGWNPNQPTNKPLPGDAFGIAWTSPP